MLSTVSDTESTLNRCYLYTLLIMNYNCNNFSKEKPIFTDNLELQAAPLNHAAMEGEVHMSIIQVNSVLFTVNSKSCVLSWF